MTILVNPLTTHIFALIAGAILMYFKHTTIISDLKKAASDFVIKVQSTKTYVESEIKIELDSLKAKL